MHPSPDEERVIVVNEQDEELYTTPRSLLRPEEYNRASALWIYDTSGNVLLAQRAHTKRFDPGKWSSGAAGTVSAGETYETNAYKELEEELGVLHATLHPGPKIKISTQEHHAKGDNFFVHWFSTCIPSDTIFTLQASEVENVKWFSPKELRTYLSEQPDLFAVNFLLCKDVILQFLRKFSHE